MNYGGIFEKQYFLYEKMSDFLPHREDPATPVHTLSWADLKCYRMENQCIPSGSLILIPSVSYPFPRNVMWQRYIDVGVGLCVQTITNLARRSSHFSGGSRIFQKARPPQKEVGRGANLLFGQICMNVWKWRNISGEESWRPCAPSWIRQWIQCLFLFVAYFVKSSCSSVNKCITEKSTRDFVWLIIRLLQFLFFVSQTFEGTTSPNLPSRPVHT